MPKADVIAREEYNKALESEFKLRQDLTQRHLEALRIARQRYAETGDAGYQAIEAALQGRSIPDPQSL